MIGEKIVKIMSEIEPVLKTDSDDGTYKTARAEDVVRMVRPLLVKNKVGIFPIKITNYSLQGNRVNIAMLYQIMDLESADKDYIEIEVPGGGYDDKLGTAVFSALTGAFKYALQQSFAIPVKDVENNANMLQENKEETSSEENTKVIDIKSNINNSEEIKIDVMSDDVFDNIFSVENM